MKNIFLAMSFLITMSSFASIEHEPNSVKPTQAEIAKNRSCFEELSKQGCGDPGEDPQQFRSCMTNVYSTLSKDCKGLMSKLYGNQ